MKQLPTHATIVIDVFRAFTTASYILERTPDHYILSTKSDVISRLSLIYPNTLLIGKPEINATLIYDIPNSPTRTKEREIKNKTILHRTEAGAKGVLDALKNQSSVVLAAGFVNAHATVEYIKLNKIQHISILPMGHEAATPSLEDDICAQYIQALIENTKMDLELCLSAIRESVGRYFFTDDQWQYPKEDLERCLKLNRFNFAIQAILQEEYAVLTRCDINPELM
jgi:2-phosphosulfolactate phosphatase